MLAHARQVAQAGRTAQAPTVQRPAGIAAPASSSLSSRPCGQPAQLRPLSQCWRTTSSPMRAAPRRRATAGACAALPAAVAGTWAAWQALPYFDAIVAVLAAVGAYLWVKIFKKLTNLGVLDQVGEPHPAPLDPPGAPDAPRIGRPTAGSSVAPVPGASDALPDASPGGQATHLVLRIGSRWGQPRLVVGPAGPPPPWQPAPKSGTRTQAITPGLHL